MTTASALAIAAAFNSVDPRTLPLGRGGSAGAGGAPPFAVDAGLPALDRYEALLGRRLRPTPAHLTGRVLYVPSHDDGVTHLPVYDFTAEFRAAVGDEPLGSSRFKTKFGLMAKPVGDGRGAGDVSYLVDFEPPEARSAVPSAAAAASPSDRARRRKSSTPAAALVTRATVQRRSLYGGGAQVGLTIPPLTSLGPNVEDGEVACAMAPASMTMDIPLVTSFPVAPTESRFGSSRNPWFTFTVPSLLDEERTLQWQMHPVQLGMLRYTLVEIPNGAPFTTTTTTTTAAAAAAAEQDPDGKRPAVSFSAVEDANDHLVRAIYHNVGLGFSLSQPFSEGALLLQGDLDPELEAIIVASLLGLLWRMRNEEGRPRKASKPDVGGRPARKGSVDEGGPASPGKKRLFSKILGKK